MPPQIDVLLRTAGEVPLSHDEGGILLKLGKDATDLLRQALNASEKESVSLLESAVKLRLRERAGWLAVRTPQHPKGDLLGAAKAAAGLGVLYIKLFRVEEAREWLWRALIECPLQEQEVRLTVQHNLDQLELIARVRHVQRRVRIHGLVAKPHYNGRYGIVVCHTEERWEVLLEPANEGGLENEGDMQISQGTPDTEPCLLRVRPANITFV